MVVHLLGHQRYACHRGECSIQGFESEGLVDRVAAVHASPASRLGTTCDYEECQ